MNDAKNTTDKEQRQRYLTRAMELFGSQSFETVTNEEIANTLRISVEELNEMFPSKFDLYVEGVRMVQTEVLDVMTFDEDMTFEQGLKNVVRNFVIYVSQKPTLFQALLSSDYQGGDQKDVQSIVQETREEMVHRIATKMGVPGDIPMVRLLIRGSIGFVEATAIAWMEKGDLHLEQVIELVNGALHTSLIPLAALFPKQ